MSSILDNLPFQPGDKLKLKDWYQFEWYCGSTDQVEHDPVWIEPGTIFEVYSAGTNYIDHPYYTFELDHHIHGDITIDVYVKDAVELFELYEKAED